ncbi:hypothetical protein BSZ19_24445 [Bradyrhizobium japonicum]|uniref:Uncharacterized protein n=1 Tax=Bradyrhizobium japonicum TaxID=375 RepID=A0A1Y2JKC1_BRAJP|nr:hypothetical protein BSZ19_24445 [Bradyrhizobium japonicum]
MSGYPKAVMAHPARQSASPVDALQAPISQPSRAGFRKLGAENVDPCDHRWLSQLQARPAPKEGNCVRYPSRRIADYPKA